MAITPEDLITKSFKIVTEESGYDRNEVDASWTSSSLSCVPCTPSAMPWSARWSSSPPRLPHPRPPPSPRRLPPPPAPRTPQPCWPWPRRCTTTTWPRAKKAKAELLDEAEKKADALVSEARQQREEVLARLTDEKEELEIAVEALRGFESRYRTKLLDHLNNQVEELKNLKSIEASA